MPEPPTFGRYAEIPYDQMTPEQQEAYRFAVETRGPLGGPSGACGSYTASTSPSEPGSVVYQ